MPPPIARPKPLPGQESVWDYPRPPRLEQMTQHVTVVFNGVTIVDTHRPIRILETSHPPTYYLPPEDCRMEYFTPVPARHTYCEWKGEASYYTIRVGDKAAPAAAWTYHNPSAGYTALRGYIALYAGRVDACYVDGEKVQAQPGDFYGGWITAAIVGPFKGEPGTYGW